MKSDGQLQVHTLYAHRPLGRRAVLAKGSEGAYSLTICALVCVLSHL